jgi:hypothetical protein
MGMYGKVLDGYLRVAGSRLGSKLYLDRNGICVLKKDSPCQEYIVELPKDSDVVYFYAPICKVPYEGCEEFFEKILEMNLCGMAYNQATFGLDRKTQNIVLSYTRSMGGLDEATFSNILCNFVRVVDRAKVFVSKLAEETISAATLTVDDVAEEVGAKCSASLTSGKLRV